MNERKYCPTCGRVYLKYVTCWQSSFCVCNMKVTIYMTNQTITYQPPVARTEVPRAFYKAFEDDDQGDIYAK